MGFRVSLLRALKLRRNANIVYNVVGYYGGVFRFEEDQQRGGEKHFSLALQPVLIGREKNGVWLVQGQTSQFGNTERPLFPSGTNQQLQAQIHPEQSNKNVILFFPRTKLFPY